MTMTNGPKPSRTPQTGRRNELEGLFLDRYRSVQYEFIQMFTEHLADCSREFHGDLLKMLVLAIVGQAYLEGLARADDRTPGARLSVTASRISDISGIPRQTVRRKLLDLRHQDWIEQINDQSWRLAVVDGDSAARRFLVDLDRRGILRAARFYAKLETLAAVAPPDGP